jgi:phosphotransferase system HPr-like phosphotransfer protein
MILVNMYDNFNSDTNNNNNNSRNDDNNVNGKKIIMIMTLKIRTIQ